MTNRLLCSWLFGFLLLPVGGWCASAGASPRAFDPSGTYFGAMIMMDVKELGGDVCEGNLGAPFYTSYTVVSSRNGRVTVNDVRNIARRGKTLPGARFKANARLDDGMYRWTYTVTGSRIGKSKGTIREVITRVLATDIRRGCRYTSVGRDLARSR